MKFSEIQYKRPDPEQTRETFRELTECLKNICETAKKWLDNFDLTGIE